MARKLRLEAEGGLYHIFNRGNYRSPIFKTEKTKSAFLKCLREACEKTGWQVYAWCVMSNHYHLAVETPQPNLVDGMRWLQNTFATRFNGLRSERGHLFQERYHSLAVEADRLGPLCHSIHLNPVRAKLCRVETLNEWAWSSYHWIHQTKLRPTWYSPQPPLTHAGELRDSPAGRNKYGEYLAWRADDEPLKKELGFAQMCQGWAIGSVGFQKALVDDYKEAAAQLKGTLLEMRELKEQLLSEKLDEFLQKVRKTSADLSTSGKSEPWKVAVGAALKTHSVATNQWLASHLFLGHPDEASRKIHAWLKLPDKTWRHLLQ